VQRAHRAALTAMLVAKARRLSSTVSANTASAIGAMR
jgi:hypothetical protein